MKIESTETQEKKLETLEEAAMAVLNESELSALFDNPEIKPYIVKFRKDVTTAMNNIEKALRASNVDQTVIFSLIEHELDLQKNYFLYH